MVILIVSHEAKMADGHIPQEFTSILEEFFDIIPNELPKQLPSMCNIQHAIGLVPRSTLPNLPHYHMSPVEHEKIN